MALAVAQQEEIDFSQFDRETLQVLEAYAVEDLKFYNSLQVKLEELAKTPALQPLIPHHLDLAEKCEVRLEMIRKALTPYLH